jgi:hypothetical protein
MAALVACLEAIGAAQVAATELNEYGLTVVRKPTMAVNAAALLQMILVLQPLLLLGKVCQVPLKLGVHLVLSKQGMLANEDRCEHIAATLRVALGHVRRIATCVDKRRQACRFLSMEQDSQMKQLCKVAAGESFDESPSKKHTLLDLWATKKTGEKCEATSIAHTDDDTGFSTGFDPSKFAAEASVPGGQRKVAGEATRSPVATPLKRQRVKGPEILVTPDRVEAEKQPVPVVTTPKVQMRGLISPGIGKLYLSLGAKKSEICMIQIGSTRRQHLLTIESTTTRFHKELATQLVRLATSTEISLDELKAVKTDRLHALQSKDGN